MILSAKIIKGKFEENKSTLEIEIDKNILNILQRQKTKEIEINIEDGRTITPGQRKKAMATINDISEYTGDIPEYLKEKYKFKLMAEKGIEYFSLSNCSVETARDYITIIIDDAVEHGIPLLDLGINRAEEIDRYLYKCLATRTCAITGTKNADIHHVLGSRIGMGRNRKKVNHNNLELIALSRSWHTKVHAEGEDEIFNKYKIYGIALDHKTLRYLNLKTEEIT